MSSANIVSIGEVSALQREMREAPCDVPPVESTSDWIARQQSAAHGAPAVIERRHEVIARAGGVMARHEIGSTAVFVHAGLYCTYLELANLGETIRALQALYDALGGVAALEGESPS